MNKNIKNFFDKIEEEKRKIANCKHEFNEPFFNPETVKEPYGEKLVTQGSDAWYRPTGYRNVQKNRWTRICKLCEFEEHTYNTTPIITGFKPSF